MSETTGKLIEDAQELPFSQMQGLSIGQAAYLCNNARLIAPSSDDLSQKDIGPSWAIRLKPAARVGGQERITGGGGGKKESASV